MVELFVLGPDDRYTEIELGPHGHHLVLQLHGLRNIVARELPLRFEAQILGDRWRGRAWLDTSLLPPGPHRLNAYAIRGVGADRHSFAWSPVSGPQPAFPCLLPTTAISYPLGLPRRLRPAGSGARAPGLTVAPPGLLDHLCIVERGGQWAAASMGPQPLPVIRPDGEGRFQQPRLDHRNGWIVVC